MKEMKVSEILFEGPYHIDQDWTPIWQSDAFISNSAMERDYSHLGTLLLHKKQHDLWLHKQKIKAVLTLKAKNDINQERNKIVVDIRFQKPAGLPIDNELQIASVHTAEDEQNAGLASALYISR